MIQHLRHFFISQKYFTAFSIIFAVYLGVVALQHLKSFPFLDMLHFIGGFLFMFFGAGVGIALILQWIFRRNFDQWEFLSLALIGAILIEPAFLTAEFIVSHKVYDWYPIFNAGLFWCGAGVLLFLKKTQLPPFFIAKSILKHPFFIVFFLVFILILIQVLLYPSLPDLDPYKWLVKYTYQFSNQQLDYAERPLFGSLVFMVTRFAGLDIFTFFKYVFPFFFILISFPAWMVARTFKDKRKQWISLFFIFSSPVIFSYAVTAMPQTVLIILAYFFMFFLIYAEEKNDSFFLYSAGAIACLSFFYHQSGIILFTPWVIFAIIKKRRLIFSDKKTIFLIGCIIASNFSFFGKMCVFLTTWTNTVSSYFFRPNNINLFYPAYYRNIDYTLMGWNSMFGVVKFYAFHMGPLVGAILACFLGMFLSNSSFRHFFIDSAKRQTGIMIGLAIFFIFFSIAEILPRFPAIALLPDRAWIFNGIFSFIFLYLILRFVKFISLRDLFIFTLLIAVCVSGVLYVNNLKRYLITSAQWESAKWIKDNLPEDRLVLSYGHKSLLPFHADTNLIRISSKVYCSKNMQDFQEIINSMDSKVIQKTFIENFKPLLNSIQKTDVNTLNFINDNTKSEDERYSGAIKAIGELREKINIPAESSKIMEVPIIYKISNLPVVNSPIPIENVYGRKIDSRDLSLKNNSLFIYYARQHKLNPYATRPYELTTWGIDPCWDGKLLFDLYPNNFKRIYQTDDEEIIIWQVLKK